MLPLLRLSKFDLLIIFLLVLVNKKKQLMNVSNPRNQLKTSVQFHYRPRWDLNPNPESARRENQPVTPGRTRTHPCHWSPLPLQLAGHPNKPFFFSYDIITMTLLLIQSRIFDSAIRICIQCKDGDGVAQVADTVRCKHCRLAYGCLVNQVMRNPLKTEFVSVSTII